MSSFQKVVWSSKSYNWDSPKQVFLDLHKEFNFNQDPTDKPLIGPGCKNGLVEPWGTIKKPGRIYLNPAYGRKLTKRWIFKAWQEMHFGRIEIVVFLLPSRTGTDWFQFLMNKGAEFRINRGRLKFGEAELGAPFDSLVAILRK